MVRVVNTPTVRLLINANDVEEACDDYLKTVFGKNVCWTAEGDFQVEVLDYEDGSPLNLDELGFDHEW